MHMKYTDIVCPMNMGCEGVTPLIPTLALSKCYQLHLLVVLPW